MKARRVNKMQALSLSTALLMGTTLAYVNHMPARHQTLTESSYVTTVVPMARPTEIDTIAWMVRQNPRLTEQNASKIYDYVSQAIRQYHGNAKYADGAARQITAKMAIAVMSRESKFDPKTLGRLGEVGLMQIYPKYHLTELTQQGIVRNSTDLWDIKTNISAGIHILMGYARNARTPEQALAMYNAGPALWRQHGMDYAKAIIRLARTIDG